MLLRSPSAGRPRQHGAGHRAQSRRDQTPDWVIDSDQRGTRGGTIVAAGTSEEVAAVEARIPVIFTRVLGQRLQRKAGARWSPFRHHRPRHGRPVVVPHGGRLSHRFAGALSRRRHAAQRADRLHGSFARTGEGHCTDIGDCPRVDWAFVPTTTPAHVARDRGARRLDYRFEKTTLAKTPRCILTPCGSLDAERARVMVVTRLGAWPRPSVTNIDVYPVG